MEKTFDVAPFIEPAGVRISDFSIGFLQMSVQDGMEEADSAGSGTLVAIDGVHGILTASHVLEALPNSGEVGIVAFARRSGPLQRLKLDMGRTAKLVLGARPFGATGPDLGFLRLATPDAERLAVRNSFLNLGVRREPMLRREAPENYSHYFDGIQGVVAEDTRDLPDPVATLRVKQFKGLFGVGFVIGKRIVGDFDLIDFGVDYGPGSMSPASYQGMSGGGLWRVYCREPEQSQPLDFTTRLYGVAFFQTEIMNGKRTIVSHGPNSVYRRLIDAVREKWPSAVAS